MPYDGSVVELLMAHIHEIPDSIAARLEEPVDEALETLIRRAMAKDPSNRHSTAGAFRKELETVMEMLDAGRRRARGSGLIEVNQSREVMLGEAFERSHLPQALVSLEGVLAIANRAFAKLVGHDDARNIDGVPRRGQAAPRARDLDDAAPRAPLRAALDCSDRRASLTLRR